MQSAAIGVPWISQMWTGSRPKQVAVMIAISTISLSVHRFGRITDYYRAQARRAVQAYLGTRLD
jgi:hypothetical protein